MARKCSVPKCNSNYASAEGHVNTFRFPKDEALCKKWIRKINRKNFSPGPSACVCILHFEERFIVREHRATRDDGTILTLPRKVPTLTKDAYPTIFQGQPKYLSTSLPLKRTAPEERQAKIVKRCDNDFQKWCEADKIPSFKDFSTLFSSKLTNAWGLMHTADNIIFLNIDPSDISKVIVSFKIKDDLSVEIFQDGLNITTQFVWLLGDEFLCDKWTKFESLLSHLHGYTLMSKTIDDKLKFVTEIIQNCSENTSDDSLLKRLQFLKEQIFLLTCKQPKYSSDMMLWACSIFYTSPCCYIRIRESSSLTLPHTSYLKKLALHIGSPSSGLTKSYLAEKSKLLKDHEKTVTLLLDEIYIKPTISYKSGKIEGFSYMSSRQEASI